MVRLLIVAALILLVFAITAFIRRRSRHSVPIRSVQLLDFEIPANQAVAIVGFFSKFCLSCQQWTHDLERAGLPFNKIDVGKQHHLTVRYKVLHTPVVMAISTVDGRVIRWYDEAPEPEFVEDLKKLVAAG